LAFLVAGFMAGPASAAQAPTAAAPTPALREWVGTWSGSARLTNEAGDTPCAYEGAANPAAATLVITAAGAGLQGTLKLALPARAGSACPAIERAADLRDVIASGSSLTFSGPGKHAWTLGRRGQELVGTVAWKGTSGEEVGALRLSGEVRLQKAGTARKGGAFGAMGGIIAANVVGIGAFALANKAGKGADNGPPQVSCSPRRCFLVSLSEPCQCNTTLTSGSVCGTTTSGVGYAGVCNVDGGQPCQAGLSCNSGICEDRFGHCPF
jgi:hypothetical protein